MTGAELLAAIAAASDLINPRLSEIDWDDVAAELTPPCHWEHPSIPGLTMQSSTCQHFEGEA